MVNVLKPPLPWAWWIQAYRAPLARAWSTHIIESGSDVFAANTIGSHIWDWISYSSSPVASSNNNWNDEKPCSTLSSNLEERGLVPLWPANTRDRECSWDHGLGYSQDRISRSEDQHYLESESIASWRWNTWRCPGKHTTIRSNFVSKIVPGGCRQTRRPWGYLWNCKYWAWHHGGNRASLSRGQVLRSRFPWSGWNVGELLGGENPPLIFICVLNRINRLKHIVEYHLKLRGH